MLVVDDSPVAAAALASSLRREGFDVSVIGTAAGARNAIAARSAGTFDLVLMDLQLPDGTGIDCCAYLKRQEGWQDVPVIVVTSSDDDQDLALAFGAGASDYILKPTRELELLTRVRAAIRLRQEMTRRESRERELEDLNARLTRQTEELTGAREALITLNLQLEERVREQVQEIVDRAAEIDMLNARLRVQVQERSRELAQALRRLTLRGVGAGLAAGAGTELGGRVRLLRHLGSGGMGRVYAAEDLVTGSPVAVKLLDSRLDLSTRDLQRFIEEAAAAAAIDHPAIVRTLHVDVTEDGQPFLMMELVEGVTLSALLASRRLPMAACVSVGRVVADALAAAHRAGVIHRDIKPANLIVSRRAPGVRVLDFGISKTHVSRADTTWTRTGALLGTPAYMSPEQIDDASDVTPASDVYSLGAVLFEMLTGTTPFGAADSNWIRRTVEASPRTCDLVAGLPPPLGEAIDRCLLRAPDRRPSARELAEQLGRLTAILGAPDATSLLAADTEGSPATQAAGASR